MRSEFEKYIREQSGFTSDFQVGSNGQYKSDLMHFMFITWQHQQSKVDGLQKRVDGAYIKLAMLRQTELWQEDDIYELFEELEQALKGGSDEIQNR